MSLQLAYCSSNMSFGTTTQWSSARIVCVCSVRFFTKCRYPKLYMLWSEISVYIMWLSNIILACSRVIEDIRNVYYFWSVTAQPAGIWWVSSTTTVWSTRLTNITASYLKVLSANVFKSSYFKELCKWVTDINQNIIFIQEMQCGVVDGLVLYKPYSWNSVIESASNVFIIIYVATMLVLLANPLLHLYKPPIFLLLRSTILPFL